MLEELIDSASGRADYADARHVVHRREVVGVRNGIVSQLDTSEAEGVGVRVRAGGAWGYAACRSGDRAAAEAALERALAVAAAQPATEGAELAPEPPARGSYSSPAERDPFVTSLEDKLGPLLAAEALLREEPGVTVGRARFVAFATETAFASTDGALFEQRLTECGGGLSATAVGDDQTQVRSWPASHSGSVRQAGFEHFAGLALAEAAPGVAAEAAALLRAPACPRTRTNLILAGEQLALQLHESVGHALELDRVLGREASYAGTSFVPADGIGSFVYGSPLMRVTGDATTPGGLGSFSWDDEGVEGQRVPLVSAGVLHGFLSSRETATELGLPRSGGCMRAEGFARQPIVRMTNVNLEPGEAGTLDDLIAATERGLLVETNRSWSIDQRRLQFRFEGELGWEIEDGRRARMVRSPSYTGLTPELWGSLDAVCSPSEWELTSLLDCGKGEPGQIMHVSHGAAPARFRDVEVGVA